MTARPYRLLILHAGALGDLVLTSQLAVPLRAAFPGAEVSCAARSGLVHWLRRTGVFDRSFDLDALGLHRLFAASEGDGALSPVGGTLREFELIICFLFGPETPQAAVLARETGSWVVAVDPRVRPETVLSRRHITDQWLDDMRRGGLKLPVVDHRRSLVAESNSPPGANCGVIVCHPGSGGRGKCAPVEWWERIVRRWGASREGIPATVGARRDSRTSRKDSWCANGASALRAEEMWRGDNQGLKSLAKFARPPGGNRQGDAVGSAGRPGDTLRSGNRCGDALGSARWMIGPTERDWFGQAYVDRLAAIAPVIEEQDISEAADRLARSAAAFIGHDAGITHLAAGLGLPTLAVFVSTDEAVWRPLGSRVATVRYDPSGPIDQLDGALADWLERTRRRSERIPAESSGP